MEHVFLSGVLGFMEPLEWKPDGDGKGVRDVHRDDMAFCDGCRNSFLQITMIKHSQVTAPRFRPVVQMLHEIAPRVRIG